MLRSPAFSLSCPVPNTYTSVIENGNSSKAQFKLRIFSFVNNSVVYLHCRLRVCVESPRATCKTVSVCALSMAGTGSNCYEEAALVIRAGAQGHLSGDAGPCRLVWKEAVQAEAQGELGTSGVSLAERSMRLCCSPAVQHQASSRWLAEHSGVEVLLTSVWTRATRTNTSKHPTRRWSSPSPARVHAGV